jgi:chromosomal replication initiation ATPase DnaA
MPARQIPLDLPVSSAEEREDLIVSPANAHAVDFIEAWPDWPGPLAVLAGPVGSGKTHMARIWAALSGAQTIAMDELDAAGPEIADARNIVVEDACVGVIPETALFHVVNHIRAIGGHCLITSREWPTAWRVALPDLASRLRAAQLVELSEPDDTLLRQVIVKLFADRQIAVDAGVVDYVVLRMERSLGAARELVAEMDREALSRNARVTRTIAAAALKKLTMACF